MSILLDNSSVVPDYKPKQEKINNEKPAIVSDWIDEPEVSDEPATVIVDEVLEDDADETKVSNLISDDEWDFSDIIQADEF